MAKQTRPAKENYDWMFNSEPVNLQEAVNKYYSNTRVELPLMYRDAANSTVTLKGKELENYETVKNKYGEFDPTVFNPEAVLDARQPWYSAASNGVVQFLSKTGTSALNTALGLEVSALNYLGQGIARGEFRASDFTMDPLTQALNNFDKAIADAFPIYKDPEEYNQPWYKQNFGDFISGEVLPNFGFMVGTALGAFATEGIGLTGQALKIAGKSAKVAQGASNIIRTDGQLISKALRNIGLGGKAAEESAGIIKNLTGPVGDFVEGYVKNAFKGKGLVARQAYGSALAAVAESKLEAVGTYDEVKQDLLNQGYDESIADEYARKSANVDFLLNMPVLMGSNMLQFGSVFTTGKTMKQLISGMFKKGSGLSSSIEGSFEKEFTTKNLNTFLNRTINNPYVNVGGRVIGTSLREGGEEWIQYMGNKVAKNYSNRILHGYDNGYSGMFSGIQTLLDSTQDEFSDPENYNFAGEAGENFILGALMGSIGLPTNLKGDFAGGIIGSVQDYKKQQTENQERNSYVNSVVESLNKVREKYGTNKAFKDALVSLSFKADSAEAMQDGDVSTAHIMDAMGLAHDIITATEAGRGDEFINFLTSTEAIKGDEVREYLKQNTKEGQVDPLKNLTNQEIEEKVNKNKQEILDKVNTIKRIHSKVSALPNMNPALAKEITTRMFAVEDIEKRFQTVTEELKDFFSKYVKIPEFQNDVNEFLNSTSIKETLANVNNNKGFSKFVVDALSNVSNLVEKGVISNEEASDVLGKVFDLSRNALIRSNTLKQFNKIVTDPYKYNQWVDETVKEKSPEKALEYEFGKRISSAYNSRGFIVPENINNIEEGELFGKLNGNLFSITKTKDGLDIKVNGEKGSLDQVFQITQQKDFTPLTKEQFIENQEAQEAVKRKQASQTAVANTFIKAIEKLEKSLENKQKGREKLIKEKEVLVNKVNKFLKQIDSAKKEIEELAKTKNKFKKQDIPVLEELIKETEEIINSIQKEIDSIDNQIDKTLKLEEEATEKIEFLMEEVQSMMLPEELKDRINELYKLAEDDNIKSAIEALENEKQKLIDTKEELIELFNDLKEENNLIKVFETLEEIENRLSQIPDEIEDLKEVLLNKDILQKAKTLENVYTQLTIDIKQKLEPDVNNSNAAPIEEQEINVEFEDSSKKPITFGFFTTTGDETIEGTDIPKENEREKRWYNYINNTPKKELKKLKLLVFTKNSVYNNLDKLGEELYDSKGDNPDMFVLVTNNKGEPLLDDNGKYIWTSIHLPTRSSESFSYPKELDESQKELLYLQSQKDFLKFREQILEMEKNGEKPLVNIKDRSRGKSKKEVTTGNNLQAATGLEIKKIPLVVAFGQNKSQPTQVTVGESTLDDVPNGSVWTETKLGDPLLVTQTNLKSEDAEAVFELIKRVLNKEKTLDNKNLRNILEDIIFVGKQNNKKYNLYLTKTSLVIGDKIIDKSLLDEYKDEIIEFLKNKRYNVNKKTLDTANKTLKENKNIPKFYLPVIKNGELTFEEFESYKHWLINYPLKVYAPNVGESSSVNKYLIFEPELEKPKSKKEEVDIKLENASTKEDFGFTSPSEEDLKAASILDTISLEEEPVESSWKTVQKDYNLQRDANRFEKNSAEKEDDFVKSLEYVLENSTDNVEIDLARKALNKIKPKKDNLVDTPKVDNLDVNIALSDFSNEFGADFAPGTVEQQEQGKKIKKNCNNNEILS